MSVPDRQELIRNATAFLADPKTRSSPVAQRIQFLEAKGLTAEEIEHAIQQAAINQRTVSPYPGAYPPLPYAVSPPAWDWRDTFITAVVSGTLAYGAVTLFKKYLLPHLRPPSLTAYEEDCEGLTAQFDAAEAVLKEILAETQAVRAAVEQQKEQVDKTTQDIEDIVKEVREGEVKTRDGMREIREEINNVREMLPKMIEKNKESQTQSLAELQQELKSLKALLLSRGLSTPSTASPTLSGRPSIPQWQLAGTNQSSGIVQSPQSAGDTPNTSISKGKEVDHNGT